MGDSSSMMQLSWQIQYFYIPTYLTRTGEMVIRQIMGKKVKKEEQLPPVVPVKAYFIYRNEVYETVKNENNTMNKGDLAQLIADKWDNLEKSVKQTYEDTYKKNMDKYKHDLEEYEKKYGKVEEKPQQVAKPEKKNKPKKTKEQTQPASPQEEESQQGQEEKAKKKPSKKSQTKTAIQKQEKKPKKKGKNQEKSKGKSSKVKAKGKKQDEGQYRMKWYIDKNAGSGDQADD